MTLIKMYFVSIIRKFTSEVSEKMVGKVGFLSSFPRRDSHSYGLVFQDLSETAVEALLYSKFSKASEILRILIFELEKRSRAESGEYNSLLQECYTAWFTSRTSLLSNSLAEEVRRMEPATFDLIKLVGIFLRLPIDAG